MRGFVVAFASKASPPLSSRNDKAVAMRLNAGNPANFKHSFPILQKVMRQVANLPDTYSLHPISGLIANDYSHDLILVDLTLYSFGRLKEKMYHMKKYSTLLLSALAAITVLAGSEARAQTNKLSSVAITTGVVSVTERIGTVANQSGSVANNLAGLAYAAGNIPGAVDTSISFFALTGATIPPNAANSFTSYGTLIGPPTAVGSYPDVAAALTANSYSGLTFAIDDLGVPIAGCFYTIHHKASADYFTVIVPKTSPGSTVTDLKPMSWQAVGGVAGGPADAGLTGYFALAYASGAVTGYAANSMFYLRTDSSSHTQFGSMIPALTGASSDSLDLTTAVGSFGVGGYINLAYSPTPIGGYAANQFYYLRTDSVTGNTILGRLDPSKVAGTRTVSDIANLGGVFNTLTFAVDATGASGVWGSNQLYATGSLAAGAQSISFAAIANHIVGDAFTVTPTASSGLDLDVTVVSGPATIATTGVNGINPSQRVFTVTTTGPGIVKLQARQAGQAAPLFTANSLQQSFNVLGFPTVTSAISAPGTVGTVFTYNITATGAPLLSFAATGLPASLVLNTTTGVITGTPLVTGVINATLTATNATGTSVAAPLTITVAAAGVAPIITNSPLTAAGTVGTPFSFTITASGTPTSYTATPLPAGLVVNTATGAITGTPTTVGTTAVLLGATNATGTGNATLTVTVAAAGVAPVITNSPLTAAGTIGTPFSLTITASGTPTSYTATPLPAGLTVNTLTGAITGTPTTAGTTATLLGATNGIGTGNATLTITVAAAGVAPIITNSPLTAAGTIGTPFSFTITATGLPTSYTATPLPAGLSIVALTGAITGTPTTAGTTAVLLGATNSTGTGNATLTITVAAAGVAPIITNSPLTAAGTIGTPFSFTTTATGLPTSYTATPLPAGLSIVALTGAITGTPTTAGTTAVLLGATNSTGTGNATLTITVAAAGIAPVITNNPLTAAGTVGTPFSFAITASGLPTSYSASPLPAGLFRNALTGTITGTPTTVGTTAVLLGATNSTGTGNATLTITIAAAGVAPVITNNPLTAAGTVGTPFSFTITASGQPSSYTASPLPAGLIRNASTGAITGTPTSVGTTAVLLGATNNTGTGNATLTITVAAAGVTPIITNNPLTAAGTVGTPFSFVTVASGLPTSYTAAPLPAGLSIVALTGIITGTPTAAGTTSVVLGATNTTGTGNATLVVTVAAAGVVPIITNNQPTAGGTAGEPFNYTIVASGLPTSYGATNLPPGLVINTTTGVITGKPITGGTWIVTITATNSTGTSTAYVTITIASSRISALSARAMAGQGDQTLIVGFLSSGNGKNVLVRGVGPTLTYYGVAAPLADPILTLYGKGIATATNDDWSTTADGQPNSTVVAATAARVYAASLPTGSKDSALLISINGGVPTTALVTTNGASGIALAEIYDADAENASRLTSVAARMNVTAGEGAPIVGLVIAGNAPKTVLIRGIGPTLANYGVSAVLADPTISVYSGSTQIGTNDNWEAGTSTAAQIIDISSQVGAFPLPAGSKDAVLLMTLQPGNYTVRVPNSGSSTGVVLVEVYDTQ